MRVLHGIWVDAALCVWAEDSGLPAHGTGTHPFACQATEIADLLEPLGDLVRKAVDGELTLRLPTAAGSPVASPELIRDDAPASWRRKLAPWRIPVLRFDPAAARDLLTALEDNTTTISTGQSMPYLATAFSISSRFRRPSRSSVASSAGNRSRPLPMPWTSAWRRLDSA